MLISKIWIVSEGQLKVTQELLNNKANISAKDKTSQALLHIAYFKGNKKIQQTLIAGGANIYALDKELRVPSDLANVQGDKHVLQRVISSDPHKIGNL